MIRALILLGLMAFATPVFGGDSDVKAWEEDLHYRFGLGWNDFVQCPRTIKDAKAKNFEKVPGPTQPSGYEGLDGMWVKKDEECLLVGLYFDKKGNIAAMQINQPISKVWSYFDVIKQGFKTWKYNSVEYLYITIYFVAPEGQASGNYSETKTVRDDYVRVASFDGTLDKIETSSKTINPIWTRQACIMMMGRHYYYNMTQELTCNKPFHPFFPLYDEHNTQIVGMGLMYIGTSQCKLEKPSLDAVKMIVPTAPQCLYDLVQKYGASTLHVYFVDRPRFINC